MADEIFGQSSYSRSMASFGKGSVYHIADKLYGTMVTATDSLLRSISEKTGTPYIAPVDGYISQLAAKTLFRLLFTTKTESIATNTFPATDDFYVQYNPKVSKEVFFKIFQDEFVNTNRFYVEFLSPNTENIIGSDDANKYIFSNFSTEPLKSIPSVINIQAGTQSLLKSVSDDDNYKILLNYLVDNVQFPNFSSKKSTFTRMGQTMEFVNNQQWDGDLTITFTYDMRGNIDRFLHYIAEKSKYYSADSPMFDIRITTFKPLHKSFTNLADAAGTVNPALVQGGSSGNTIYSADLKLDSKTFKNIQLTSKPNYQLTNSESNIIHRTATFSYLGVQEKVYDYPLSDDKTTLSWIASQQSLSEFVYDMYDNLYQYNTTLGNITE